MNSKPDEPSALATSALPLLMVTHEATAPLPRQNASRTALWKVLAAVLLVLLVAALLWGPLHDRRPLAEAETGKAGDTEAHVVVALGRLVPQGELRTLAAPFGASDARVANILVKEGQAVSANTPMVVFDSAPMLDAALAVAERQLLSRQAAWLQAQRSVALSQADARAAAARARVAASAAEVEYRRWATLVEQGFVSAAAADERRTRWDEAVQDLARAEASLSRHVGEGATQPDLLVAQRDVEAAKAEYERARSDLAKAVLRAPSDGTVIAIHAQPGERPGSGGVLDFGDTRVMTVELEVYQSDVARVAVGQRVLLHSGALTAPLSARVSHMGLSVGRQRLTESSPAANTDARVVRVTAVLDKDSSERARAWLGLEVRGDIDTRPGAP